MISKNFSLTAIGIAFFISIGSASAQPTGSASDFSQEGQNLFKQFSKGFVCAFTPNDCKSTFVKEMIAQLGATYPTKNIVICATNLNCDWPQMRREYMYHKVDYDYTLGGNVSYHVWAFERSAAPAVFVRHGDGGWLNWAYRGWVDRNDNRLSFN